MVWKPCFPRMAKLGNMSFETGKQNYVRRPDSKHFSLLEVKVWIAVDVSGLATVRKLICVSSNEFSKMIPTLARPSLSRWVEGSAKTVGSNPSDFLLDHSIVLFNVIANKWRTGELANYKLHCLRKFPMLTYQKSAHTNTPIFPLDEKAGICFLSSPYKSDWGIIGDAENYLESFILIIVGWLYSTEDFLTILLYV